ncbi:glycoside hydrolase superfamily [Podospora didyma]|uniref:Glycoside hydrolase superfamily n=1 Tax=Podospora didyma TaxID=330526 RepID=A0AAE0N935_9PEZI|nr:glycoside hydrolase superfamily [Podospora didyma]
MRLFSSLAAVGVLAAGASAENYLGFNSGSTLDTRAAKFKADFTAEFTTAQKLAGAPGVFNAVRLYTNIQAYSVDDPIEAFEAAIDTKTKILLGIWTSGTDSIDKEISALLKAVTKFGSKFTDLVIGMSIGSEDLYRISVTGIANKAGVGASPDQIIKFINTYKKAVANTALSKVPIGHVDTWDSWTNATNKAVIDAIDWVGVDEYPYYENGKGNDIKNSGTLFDKAFDATVASVGGKPVWVTETGWPASGPNWDLAVASTSNAEYYWQEVGCRKLFNKVPTFWYNLRDSNPDNTMKFAIAKDLKGGEPKFNLTCPTTFDTPSGTTSGSATSSTGVAASSSSSATTSTSTTNTGTTGAGAQSGTTTTSGTPAAKSSSPAVALSAGVSWAGVGVLAGLFAALF